ncbi:Reverse transcriptase domain-containing protein [Aphis craccivora]|uniref:RNA-directed DNA polymerase n=1 Tax=Aphis craccivora TaxID=307492 RepID=A0A6G0VTB1_APHCR|nr:Reverse transcriptase domain-containing protein [Aphis craccivora]
MYGDPNLLGRDFMEKFNIKLTNINMLDDTEINLKQLKNKYSKLFNDDMGKFVNEKFKIRLKDDATPIFYKPRQILFAFKDKVEEQLCRLEKLGVISQVESSEWGSPLVPILKSDGKIRLCADYKVTVNKFVQDVKYPLPRIEEMFQKVSKGKEFSKIDLSEAYNQLELDEESSKILTWSTHKGLFKVHRLPYGVAPASAIFQKLIEQLFQGHEGVANFLDDIIITGQNNKEHLKNLDKVFNILYESGLKVKLSKCEFFKSEIEYLGHIISAKGLRKCENKVRAIVDAPAPCNITQVKSFADNVLVHFNSNYPIILSTDASNEGIAGCLSHIMPDGSERPISFISRIFVPAENNYFVTDKEALAIYWSVRKLFQYLQNQKFTIRTDHKLLIGILGENKNIPTMASARFQRWAVFLAGFQYTLEYIKGNDNCTSDLLSRLPIKGKYVVSVDSEPQSTYMAFIESEYFPLNHNTIKLQSNRDKVISKVYYYVTHGWPKSISDDLKPYKDRHTDLSVEQGCLMLGYRVVIPSKSRKQILDELHSTHLGIVKMKAVARLYVWWPKIDTHIENVVKSCKYCMQLRQNPKKSELIPWSRPSGVWQRIHIDFFGPYHNSYFLVVLDAFSKWLEVKEMRKITTDNTIVELLHLRTAPGHSATNGAAENAVKTTKHALSAALADNKNKNVPKSVILNKFLLGYRNAPHSTTGESPSVLMLGRKLRCRLDLLYKSDEEVVREKQDKSIKNYNGRQNKVFKEGDEVMIKFYKQGGKESWLKAIVKKVLGTKRYECESSDGKTFIRHVDQIIDATIVETDSQKFDSEKVVVNSTVRNDNKIKKRMINVPSKLKDFILN